MLFSSLLFYFMAAISIKDALNVVDQEIDSSCSIKDFESKPLLIVSTMDGKLTMYNLEDNGKFVWNLNPNTGPLLTSSLRKAQVMKDEKLFQIIPSLDGYLYQYYDDVIQSLPISLTDLLHSSIKLSDNAVVIGNEKASVVGINMATGKVSYTCDSNGCNNLGTEDENDACKSNILIVKKLDTVVRCINALSGNETWYIGVSDVELSSATDDTSQSKNGFQDLDSLIQSFDLKFDVSQGRVIGKSNAYTYENNEEGILWSRELSAPIASAWFCIGNFVKKLDLLDSRLVPILKSMSYKKSNQRRRPIYLGMYNGQVYVNSYFDKSMDKRGIRPYSVPLNLDFYFTPFSFDNQFDYYTNNGDEELDDGEYGFEKALQKYHFDKGLYVWPQSVISKKLLPVLATYPNKHANEEVASISTHSFYTYIFDWKCLLSLTFFLVIFTQLIISFASYSKKKFLKIRSANSTSQTSSCSWNGNLSSRFSSDFDNLKVLGRGGFGVVYKARNKVDDQFYAIKKVSLCDVGDEKEKFLREVKALAKLDHSNIVRYYQAWLESRLSLPSNDSDDCSPCISCSYSTRDSCIKVQEVSTKNIRLSTNFSVENSFSIEFKHSTSLGKEKALVSIEESCEYGDNNFKDDKYKKCSSRNSKLSLYIQMQLCHEETLKDWLKKNTLETVGYVERIAVFTQIVHAITYVHEQGLIHRDLKPSNIFFSDEKTVKIGDFGLVSGGESEDSLLTETTDGKTCQNNLTKDVGTRLYMSPEQHSNFPYTNKVDIYALGIIFFELIHYFYSEMERSISIKTLKAPKTNQVQAYLDSKENREEVNVEQISTINLKEWQGLAIEFAKWLTSKEPSNRPNSNEIISSTIFTFLHQKITCI